MTRQKRKEAKKHLALKRARLVVKNLPFTVTAEKLKEHYEKFGEVTEVNLLKKPDGNLVGCAFIQFKLVQKAAKARHHTDGKEFMDRIISCDFALSKDIYTKAPKRNVNVEVKKESESEDGIVDLTLVKDEVDDDDSATHNVSNENNFVADIKKEDENEEKHSTLDYDDVDCKDEVDSEEEEEESAENDDDDETSEDEKPERDSEIESAEEEEEESEANDSDVEESIIEEKKPRVRSNDVNEGKTVFVKNIPFSATNEQFKECISQFGPVHYALICIDKLTEHSRGTGFVKFVVSAISNHSCIHSCRASIWALSLGRACS